MADTNVKFLKENNLYEAHKQFMRMAEGYGYASPIEEDGDEENQTPDAQGGAPADGANPMGGGAPDTQGADPMGGAPESDPMGGGAPADSLPPLDTPPSSEESDEDVIDVDDVVRAQEKTNDKVNSVGRDLGTVDRRIEKLLGALEDM